MGEPIVSNYDEYIKSIFNNLSLNEEDWFFKSDPTYRGVLEHVTYEIGYRYLNEIKIRYNDKFISNKNFLINLCEENDKYGKPIKSTYNNFTTCSPTNLRYILHSFLILEYIQNSNLNNLNIIEIGGGYGGLCFFINKMSSIFNININSYTIFDVHEACKLQSLYLDKLQINNYKVFHLDNFKDLSKESFLISNYAFSEISPIIQKEYTEKILDPFVSNGFLCWNHIPLYKFINKKIHIDKARRVSNNQIFCEKTTKSMGFTQLTDFELNTKNNWVEETVVTF
jgi:hypothetical protein